MYQSYNDKEKENLAKYSALLKGFVTNGMEMLSERMNSKKTLRTDLASFLLFRQIMETGDAIGELIKIGCVNASKPLLRTLLECYCQLAYMFKDNEDRKALQFLYHYEIRKRDYYERLAYPKKGGSFFQKLKKDRLLQNEDIFQGQKQVYLNSINEITKTLNDQEYEPIKEEYSRTENKKGNKETRKVGKVKYWYELFDGPSNTESVLMQLEEPALYEFPYRDCSAYSHGEDIVHSNLESNGEDTVGISALRDIRQFSTIVDPTINLIGKSFKLFIENKVENKDLYKARLSPLMLTAFVLSKKDSL